MSGSAPVTTATPVSIAASSAAVFVVLRRMRAPLIVLIVIFTVSIVGLTLIPGESPDGPWRMGFFDAFYFMSYTATTIGFGEIPEAFNDAQRLWVTGMIYLTVVGWAYAIGTMLSLLQDRSFRHALSVRRFRRRVARLREPFWLMAGHGQTGEAIGMRLDEAGRRFVVVDLDEDRVHVLDLGSYRADVPGIVADARNPEVLGVAGLAHPFCEGVLAITDDDEANLAVTMAAGVLRPDIPVIARCSSPAVAHRMHTFATPTVINPFDRFGDHLRIALRAPTEEQLATWLTAEPGTPLPDRHEALGHGRWVVCGYGRFGREVVKDLREDDLDVVVVEPAPVSDDPGIVVGDGTEPHVLEAAGVADAAGFVAGTDNDTTNLSLIAAARRVNPGVAIVARQNQRTNTDLFAAMNVDLLMVPQAVVTQEALAHIAAPFLWQFLQEVQHCDEAWSAAWLERLVDCCGTGSPELWTVSLTMAGAPAVVRRMRDREVRLGDLLRDPQDRDSALAALPLMLARGSAYDPEPAADAALTVDDVVLMAGRGTARRSMETTLVVDTAADYVLTGDVVPSSWVWRKLARTPGPGR